MLLSHEELVELDNIANEHRKHHATVEDEASARTHAQTHIPAHTLLKTHASAHVRAYTRILHLHTTPLAQSTFSFFT